MSKKYAIGVDFGTEFGRALLVDVATGEEVATSVHPYSNGVIDEKLPDSGVRLEPDWALQDPNDYIAVFKTAVPAVLKSSGVNSADVIGVGIDFTACTMLPTKADGTPLCNLSQFHSHPHAWVKLWKHHAAQPEANKINETARKLDQKWLDRYGGKISSEWFFSKTLQILDEAPEIYQAADRLLEAADWVIWQLTGVETRNSCTAGYKALWSKREGFPEDAYFKALDPRLEHVIDQKMTRQITPIGQRAGGLTPQAAGWTGLKAGTAVAIANVDAHVAVPAATVTEVGRMVMIMGTSICHMVLGDEEHLVPGICGYVEDGIIPGCSVMKPGSPALATILPGLWRTAFRPPTSGKLRNAAFRSTSCWKKKPPGLKPGESGLLALDWWNGNRSVLVDVDLTGLLLGATLATKPEEIYRALIEATAYGTRVIVEAFEKNGVPVKELVACGGLPEKNQLLMQIYADVTGREMKVTASKQTPALGSAMFGAVAAGKAAGGYDSIFEAARYMSHLKDEVYKPIAAHSKVYDRFVCRISAITRLFRPRRK